MAETIAALFWFIAGAAASTAAWLMIMRARMHRENRRRTVR